MFAYDDFLIFMYKSLLIAIS